MKVMDLIKHFSDLENKATYIKGAENLKNAMKENGYKIRVDGAILFCDEIEDRLGVDCTNFYRMCIPYLECDETN